MIRWQVAGSLRRQGWIQCAALALAFAGTSTLAHATGDGAASPDVATADTARIVREGVVVEFSATPAKGVPTFAQVSQILKARCAVCHSGAAAQSGLRLDSLDGVLAGSSRGLVALPGDARRSELVRRIRGHSLPRMPLEGAPLSEREIVLIESWIGAGMPRGGEDTLMEGEFARLEFRIRSEANGEPLQGVYPGVWIDLTQAADGRRPGAALDCRARVGTYLQGLVGMRPMIDLNSYYVMVLNRDASIAVIDPVVGVTGITSLLTSIPLKRPGADWAKTADEKTLFVSLPQAGEVAVVDLDTFKVRDNIAAGARPMRLPLQPDGRYLWVGNDVPGDQPGGVTVIDTASLEVVATFATGVGHHEIAFSDDSRTAFVTNRGSGTVTLVDVATLARVGDIATGPVPVSVAYSTLSKALYVADGETGEVMIIDGERRALATRVRLSPGLGPLRFSQNGRWGLVVNPARDEVHVIDAASNDLAHTVPMAGRPYQLAISATFAYVRKLDSERVSMINLQQLERGGQVIVNEFAAGSQPPGDTKDLSIADAIVPAALEAAMLVVSPADATVYYYMEGMNAPMGAFRNYGHQPRAVQIANRALKEERPGVYAATVKVPAAGTFEVAFLNETPEFLHCFTLQAHANPSLAPDVEPLAIEYLLEHRRVQAGATTRLRFRLTDPATDAPREDLRDVQVKFFRAPRSDLTELTARHVGEGIYEAELPLRRAGAYYVYVAVPSLRVAYKDLRYLTLMARSGKVAAPAPGKSPAGPS